MLFLMDTVELGTKPCIERMISSQVVEKLVNIEKIGGNFRGAVVRFIRYGVKIYRMKQQVVRKVRAAVRGHKLETGIIASVEAGVF